MKNVSFFVALLLLVSNTVIAQVGINIDGTNPDPSAGLDVKFNNKGFLPPRMNTTLRDAIASPATGLVIFNTDCNDLQLFNGAGWIPVGNSGTVSAPGTISGDQNPCISGMGENYTIAVLPGANGYTWTVPVGSTITSGQGTTAITVNFGTSNGSVFVSAYGTCWRSLGSYLGINLSHFPDSPLTGTHVPSQTQIIWNWNAVQGATGYKFNSVNDYSLATDMGTSTTNTETSFTCNTAYNRYVWAYNSCGASAATTLSQTTSTCISCPTSIIDARDGKVYSTILIGNQCWMAQNLNIGTMINGSSEQTNHTAIEKYCYSNNDANCTVYGGLYQWNNMMQWSTAPGVQGICPTGWHLPTDTEWTALTTYLGGLSVAGGKMKEAGTSHWIPPNTGATNISGFTALPGGYKYGTGSFATLTFNAGFWSSSQEEITNAWYRILHFNYEHASQFNDVKTNGFSVRCVQD